MLARFERRFCRFVVRRDADDDRNGIDLRRGHHLAPIVEGEPRAIGLPRRLGAIGARRADRRQLDIGARL
jgi:hypothetical protein